jgi:hypothetical protein
LRDSRFAVNAKSHRDAIFTGRNGDFGTLARRLLMATWHLQPDFTPGKAKNRQPGGPKSNTLTL